MLVDVRHDMRVMRDESFGPIIGIQAVADDDEAVRLMNDTEYGLTAGVYTTRPRAGRGHPGPGRRRQRLLELLRPGQPPPALDRPPPLGHRARPCRRYGIRAFLQPKAWHLRSA